MGAFTGDISIANQLLMMGLPVWFVWPSFDILHNTTIKCILKWEDTEESDKMIIFTSWEDHISRPEPFPILYEGLPSHNMFWTMQRVGCRFMDLMEATKIGEGREADDADHL
jgi:hypothetical protein